MATKTMTLQVIQEMVDNYKRTQYQYIINNDLNPMPFDAQSCWFSLDALKEFIANFEQAVASHPEHPMEGLGVRFYYASYPSERVGELAGLTDVPADYAKLHTLIAVPTANINRVDSDFDPLDINTYDGSKPSDSTLSILAENHGGLTPPNSNESLWF